MVASAADALYHTNAPAVVGHFGRFMRFTSLIIELIRARPRLVVWLVVLFQAALWLLVPLLLYRSPPGDLATVIAYGREYQVGTYLGPPLAFWLADIAFRAAGDHMMGVYLLSQLCSIAMFWALYLLARAIVGGQQAVLAVLLAMTVTAFSSPGLEFGPRGAGAAVVGAVAAAFLAADRPEPAQRVVCMVDRSRALAADHLRRAVPVAPDRRICARDRARPAHADVVRSACSRCW